MIRTILILFLLGSISCSDSCSTETSTTHEKEKSLSDIFSITTSYDTINVEDKITFDVFLNDTTLIDLTKGFPQKNVLGTGFVEFNPQYTYGETIHFSKEIAGDEIGVDTFRVSFKIRTKLGADTVLNYYKLFYASRNHKNLISKGEVVNGKKEGRWVYLDKNTGLLKKVNYWKNGMKNGPDSIFSIDGQYTNLDEVNNYMNDLKEGKQYMICHDPNNNYKEYICSVWFYHKGVELDSVVRYDSQGKLISRNKKLN
ncbi:hypothetical protein D770_04940 [Flammeovirgaceae bacterium 311]|nr:hypothetical protein D770_04940 [Flammeovirgaceae bacterium 311]